MITGAAVSRVAVSSSCAAGPGTAASAASPSGWPPMHTACASVHARAGTRTVTSPSPSGATVISQTGFAPDAVCRAFDTLPPDTSRTDAASRFAFSPAGAPLKRRPTLNAVDPSWLSGTSSNVAVGTPRRSLPPVPPPELPSGPSPEPPEAPSSGHGLATSPIASSKSTHNFRCVPRSA